MLPRAYLYLLLLIKCNGYQQSSWNSQNHQYKIPQDLMVDVVNNLALKLLAIHNEGNDNNIALSPYGALSVLIALQEGLRGSAANEIHRATNIPSDISVVRIGLRDIQRHLKSYFIPDEGFLSGLTLSHDNVTLNREYEDILKFYGFDINSFNNALYPDMSTTTEELTSTTEMASTTEFAGTTTIVPDSKNEPTTELTTSTENISEKEKSSEMTSEITTTDKISTITETDRVTRSESSTAPPKTSISTITTEEGTTEINSFSSTTINTATTNVPTETITDRVTRSEASTTPMEISTSIMTTNQGTTEIVATSTTAKPTTIEDIVTTDAPMKISISTIPTEQGITQTSDTSIITESTVTTSGDAESISTSTLTAMKESTVFTSTEMTTSTESTETTPTQESTSISTEVSTTVETTTMFLSTMLITEETPVTEGEALVENEKVKKREEIKNDDRAIENVDVASKENLIETTNPKNAVETISGADINKEIETKSKTSVATVLRNSTTNTIQENDETNENLDEIKNNDTLRRNTRSVVDYIIARYYDDHSITQRPPPYNSENELYFLINGKYKEANINYMTYDTVLPFYYLSHLNTLALRFPLDSSKYYLLLLLPENPQQVNKLICDLRLNNSLKHIIDNLRYTHVRAVIPSFMLKGYVVLTSTFQKMGIQRVFEPRRADFSPMTGDRGIYVTNIEQAITVNIRNYVDPTTMGKKDGYLHRTNPVLFQADHPFLYFVIDSEIDVTLMAGKIVNPLNSRIR